MSCSNSPRYAKAILQGDFELPCAQMQSLGLRYFNRF